MIAGMRLLPLWKKLTAVAHTLPHDIEILGERSSGRPLPTSRWTAVTMPTLVIDGGRSPASIRGACQALAEVLPNAEYRTHVGQTHMIKPKALAPVLTEFFGAGGRTGLRTA
jgi:hypothetical protein